MRIPGLTNLERATMEKPLEEVKVKCDRQLRPGTKSRFIEPAYITRAIPQTDHDVVSWFCIPSFRLAPLQDIQSDASGSYPMLTLLQYMDTWWPTKEREMKQVMSRIVTSAKP